MDIKIIGTLFIVASKLTFSHTSKLQVRKFLAKIYEIFHFGVISSALLSERVGDLLALFVKRATHRFLADWLNLTQIAIYSGVRINKRNLVLPLFI